MPFNPRLKSATEWGDSGGDFLLRSVYEVWPLKIVLSPSANITASGEDTTAQLTSPAGKDTDDFDPGRIQDDENPADAVTLGADTYGEWEWCLVFSTEAKMDVVYEMRVTNDGSELDDYLEDIFLSVAAAYLKKYGIVDWVNLKSWNNLALREEIQKVNNFSEPTTTTTEPTTTTTSGGTTTAGGTTTTTDIDSFFPNDPGGGSLFEDMNPTAIPMSGIQTWNVTGTLQSIGDATVTAPIVPPKVLKKPYPEETEGGNGFGNFYHSATPIHATAGRGIYLAHAIWLSSDFHGHNSNINKMGFLWNNSGGTPGPNFYLQGYGADAGDLEMRFNSQNASSGGENRSLAPNLTTAVLTRNVWHIIECICIPNTGSSANGELHMWLNGTKTHQRTDMRYASVDGEQVWYAWQESWTWGGSNDTTPTGGFLAEVHYIRVRTFTP